MASIERYVESIQKSTFGKEMRKPIANACEDLYNYGYDDITAIQDGAEQELQEMQTETLKHLNEPADEVIEKAVDVLNDTLAEDERQHLLADGKVQDLQEDTVRNDTDLFVETSDDALAVFANQSTSIQMEHDHAMKEGLEKRDMALLKVEFLSHFPSTGTGEESYAIVQEIYDDASEEIQTKRDWAVERSQALYNSVEGRVKDIHDPAITEIKNFYNPLPALIDGTYNEAEPEISQVYTDAASQLDTDYAASKQQVRDGSEAYKAVFQSDEYLVGEMERLLDTRVVEMKCVPKETWYTYDYELNFTDLGHDDWLLDSIRPEITVSQIEGEKYQLSDIKAEDGVAVLGNDAYRLDLVNPPIAEYVHYSDDHCFVIVRNNERAS